MKGRVKAFELCVPFFLKSSNSIGFKEIMINFNYFIKDKFSFHKIMKALLRAFTKLKSVKSEKHNYKHI